MFESVKAKKIVKNQAYLGIKLTPKLICAILSIIEGKETQNIGLVMQLLCDQNLIDQEAHRLIRAFRGKTDALSKIATCISVSERITDYVIDNPEDVDIAFKCIPKALSGNTAVRLIAGFAAKDDTHNAGKVLTHYHADLQERVYRDIVNVMGNKFAQNLLMSGDINGNVSEKLSEAITPYSIQLNLGQIDDNLAHIAKNPTDGSEKPQTDIKTPASLIRSV